MAKTPRSETTLIDIEKALAKRFSVFRRDLRPRLAGFLSPLVRSLIREKDLNQGLQQLGEFGGVQFVEAALEYLEFGYRVDGRERFNIPAAGPAIIVANHPLGALDAMALLHLITSVRSDVKILGNDLLWELEPLRPLLLPVRNLGGGAKKSDVSAIMDALAYGQAVMLFPSGEVSRLTSRGIRDRKWAPSFIRLARRAHAPIVPIRVRGRNSASFYLTALLSSTAAMALLPRQMLRQKGRRIALKIGRPIGVLELEGQAPEGPKAQAELLRRHLYRLDGPFRPLIDAPPPVAHPEQRSLLRRELADAEKLGQTPDGKFIYLFDFRVDSAVMRELGRLRELTFRSVGEGRLLARDLDRYDRYYQHLILWDPDELEIAGAYRFCEAARIIDSYGLEGLYTSSLFQFGHDFRTVFDNAIELGRSFVQPRYWNTRSLDYLWYGLGAYVSRQPDIRYLFGAVSLSKDINPRARDLIISYYRKYFFASSPEVRAAQPYAPDDIASGLFGEDFESAFRILKEELRRLGATVPTLYKQYTELCEPGGATFLEFSVDPEFNDCVDGLILVDLERVKQSKRDRYIDIHKETRRTG